MELDLTYLNEMAGEDGNLRLEMISIFEEQSREYSERMHHCLTSKDWQELAHYAHKAKPSAAVVGLVQIAQELNLLESLAIQGREEYRYREIVEKYDKECKKAAEQLRKMFESV